MSKVAKFVETGALIKSQRIKKGLTQKQVSLAIGYDNEQTLSAAERGICNVPKAKIAVLAKTLGISQKAIVNAMLRQQKASLL